VELPSEKGEKLNIKQKLSGYDRLTESMCGFKPSCTST